MKRILFTLLCLCLLTVPVFGEDPETTGTCGEAIVWEYADGLLTIEGEGCMDDFEEDAPWAAFKEELTRVELKGSIEYIGMRSFTDYDALATVNFGSALYEIGTEAFMGCDGLTVISLPATFKVFGESSFNSCAALSRTALLAACGLSKSVEPSAATGAAPSVEPADPASGNPPAALSFSSSCGPQSWQEIVCA